MQLQTNKQTEAPEWRCQLLFMIITPNWPEKVQFLMDFSFPLVDELLPRKEFIGGRIGYPKQVLFVWLLIKKITNWDYRTMASMASVSHPTLIRANRKFNEAGVYQKVLLRLVKDAYKKGLIKGEKVALDSSFVKTYSRKEELGSGAWNGHKESYGFKLHALIDANSGALIALIIGDGVTHDSQVAIPLLKKARPWLKKCGYVLADKGYDSSDIVEYIVKSLHAKATIPIKKINKGKNYNPRGAYQNWKEKAKGRCIKKSIYNKRTEVERLFSTLKRTFKLGRERIRGIKAFIGQTYLACICFMLRKLWGFGVVQI